MKVSTFGKATIGLAAAATMGFGLVVPAANAATALTATQEDPAASAIGPNTLVGVGSDTIQDVEYGFQSALGNGSDGKLQLASWTATGSTPMSYRSGGAPTPNTAHPNGSGAGYKALEESIGAATTTADGVAAGDVDYSRASGFQGTAASGTTGVITEIPFAKDSISFAAPAGSPFLQTNGGKGLTVADLANIYSGTVNEVNISTGVLAKAASATTPDSGSEFIQAFLPKPGSGSRQFFLKNLNAVNGTAIPLGTNKGDGFATAAYPTTANQPYVGAFMPNGSPVQEHDASVLAAAGSGVAAIAPFSGAKYIGYADGVIADPSMNGSSPYVAGTNYVLVPFDSAVGGTAHSVLPYTGTGSSLTPNTAYTTDATEGSANLTREVFNIIPTAAVTTATPTAHDTLLKNMFVGSGSLFCNAAGQAVIQKYGFFTDSKCGDTSRTADAASTSTVTVSNTPAVAGKSTVFTVNVSSNSNGGGTVALTAAGKQYTGTIAAGQTSVNITVPTPAAGTFTYGDGATDGFTPNLEGVAASPINSNPSVPLTFKVAKTNATVKAYAARVSHTKVGKVKVVVTAPGVVVTGKVSIIVKTSKNAKVIYLPGKSLFHGSVTTTLGRKLKAGKYTIWVSYSGNSNINGKSYAKLATLTVY